MIREDARAKINLYLHIGSVREDGYHDLASLFVFTQTGDVVTARPAKELSLEITGPFAEALSEFPVTDNLVYRAAQSLRDHAGITAGAALVLEKTLPIAAGIGGGSADAAAALRALVKLWNLSIPNTVLEALAFDLGADVPACLAGAPVLVSGAGEIMEPGPVLPPLWVVLVNPGIDMPTGPVFGVFDVMKIAPPMPTHPDLALCNYEDICLLMEKSRNDLETPAMEIDNGAISEVLYTLRAMTGTLGARMSGSGATCFALFKDEEHATGALALAQKNGWWAMASRLASG